MGKESKTTLAKENRIGERRQMKRGEYCTIISYKNYNDCSVKFDDGTVVEHRRYDKFKSGNIANPNHPSKVPFAHLNSRIGERRQMKSGKWATIIAYENSLDCSVLLDTGQIIEHRSYHAFHEGTISGKNCTKANAKKHIGTKYPTAYGPVEITNYKDSHHVTVKFLNTGEILENRQLRDVKAGLIRPKSLSLPEPEIGSTHINAQGLFYTLETITPYRRKSGKDGTCECTEMMYGIRFEDGTTSTIKRKCSFYSSSIMHPLLPANRCGTTGAFSKARKPVRIGNMLLTGTAYVCDGEYNFFCECPVCGAKDILTAKEAREHICEPDKEN